jgi:hypothetical protein
VNAPTGRFHRRSRPGPVDAHPGRASPIGNGPRLRGRRRFHPRDERIDWSSLRDRIDLVDVAAQLLGDAQKGDGTGRQWWPCPFHPDRNPSFCVTPGRSSWKCSGCGARGDAAELVMKLNGVPFPEAIRFLAEQSGWVPARRGSGVRVPGRSDPPIRSIHDTRHPSSRAPSPATSQGLPLPEALVLVERARERLWSPEGLRYRRWLHLRGLTNATIRAAGLGWTPGVIIPTRGDIRYFRANGIVIPWFDGDRLAMVKIRQPAARKPKYVKAFRDGPRVYPSLTIVRSGAPLIIAEGEFDTLLLGQALGDLAAVVTVDPTSSQIDGREMATLFECEPIFAAHDADDAGDREAAAWPSPVVRVRPPAPDKDWTDAARSKVDLLRWWRDRIAGIDLPDRLNQAPGNRAVPPR